MNKKYIVIKASFEGIGNDIFETEEKFCKVVFSIFARSAGLTNKELYNKLKSYEDKTKNFNDLSENITCLIEEYDKDMILIIDEVDKSSGNRVFMQFLGVLRNKYLAQNSKEDLTFKSVILGGVNDIKNIKLKIRNEKEIVKILEERCPTKTTIVTESVTSTGLTEFITNLGGIQIIIDKLTPFLNIYNEL